MPNLGAPARVGGHDVPPTSSGPRPRVRFIILVARLFGTRSVADLVRALEGDEEELYDRPELAGGGVDRRGRARACRDLEAPRAPSRPGCRATAPQPPRPPSRRSALRVRHAWSIRRGRPKREAWHRSGQSGTLRATIFGVSDGLVSNLSLVMGVAGASESIRASSCSPGSRASSPGPSAWRRANTSRCSRSASFRAPDRARARRARSEPEEEEAELAGIYRAKGFTAAEAARDRHRLSRTWTGPRHARSRGARPRPRPARFARGAPRRILPRVRRWRAIPLFPYLFGDGRARLVTSPRTQPARPVRGRRGREPADRPWDPVRRHPPGRDRAAAAAVTYGVGTLIGVAVA